MLFTTNEKTIYHKYTNILYDIIEHIQNKITESSKDKLPILCPLEVVILYYVLWK